MVKSINHATKRIAFMQHSQFPDNDISINRWCVSMSCVVCDTRSRSRPHRKFAIVPHFAEPQYPTPKLKHRTNQCQVHDHIVGHDARPACASETPFPLDHQPLLPTPHPSSPHIRRIRTADMETHTQTELTRKNPEHIESYRFDARAHAPYGIYPSASSLTQPNHARYTNTFDRTHVVDCLRMCLSERRARFR